MNTNLITATVDLGTTSISRAYVDLLEPKNVFKLTQGVRFGGTKELPKLCKKLYEWEKYVTKTLFLFNTPTLLGGYFPRKISATRRIALMDWTANCPLGPGRSFRPIYDKIYRRAFKNLDSVISPSTQFVDFYSDQNTEIQQAYMPLPFPGLSPKPKTLSDKTRVLFIGADIKRKGGDVLLEKWEKARPTNSLLTFVCPNPPNRFYTNVTYLTDIVSGSERHRHLFETHDVLVLPSLAEPYGYVLLEAMNYGLAVLTTEAAGAATATREGGGLVFPNTYDCVDALIDLCSQPDRISEISKHTCAWVEPYKQKCRQQINDLFER